MITNIFLTGGGGFLGGNILRDVSSKINVIAVDTQKTVINRENISCVVMDLTDTSSLFDILNKSKPDVIIHTAAISDIDFCEANQDIAKKVNVDVTKALVDYCSANDMKMIYFSSDSVFDGKKGGYKAEDKPEPLQYYGRTKVIGEQYVTNNLRKWNIIRPSLIMGLPIHDFGNSFLWRMIKDMKADKAVAFPQEEIRSPVDAVTLSNAVLELADSDINGIFHLSGNTRLSRYDMAKRICRYMKYNEDLVVPKKPVVATGRAARPSNVTLDNTKTTLELKTPMRSLEEGLELILEKKGEIDV